MIKDDLAPLVRVRARPSESGGISDVDADACVGGIKRGYPCCPGESKLFPEPGIDVRNVVLAILPEVLAVLRQSRRGVVIDAVSLLHKSAQ